MGNDHEYALIGGINRSAIGRWIATLAAGLSALLVFALLSAVDVASSFGIDANVPPSLFSLIGAGTAYWLLYLFFSKYLWKWGPVAGWLKVPDISGSWKCTGVSSFIADGTTEASQWTAVVDVAQNWDKICVVLRTTQSRSESVSAALISEAAGEFRLLYHYKNDPRVFESDLTAHHGFVDLVISSNLNEADGVYFTGRGRTTYGTMHWERIENGSAN